MKETGIIMSGNHPKLILDGTKTMTRRVLRKQPLDILPMNAPSEWIGLMSRDPSKAKVFKCRYGQVGDRLWVRETCVYTAGFNAIPCWVVYKDGTQKWVDGYPNGVMVYNNDKPEAWKWRPSIHMHKFASRITLEITEVRVERVQGMSEADFIFEGCPTGKGFVMKAQKRDWFKELWDSLYAKRKPTKFDREYGGITEPITPSYEWMSNPWVWVISFKRA